MRLSPLLPIVILALAAGVSSAREKPAAPQDFPLPGYWETTTKVQSVINETKTEKHCYKAADVIRLLQPCNHHHTCEYSTQDAHNGRLTLKGEWVNKKDHRVIEVAGVGSYSHEKMTATAEMHTQFLGIPVSGKGELSARRISADCPPEAEEKK